MHGFYRYGTSPPQPGLGKGLQCAFPSESLCDRWGRGVQVMLAVMLHEKTSASCSIYAGCGGAGVSVGGQRQIEATVQALLTSDLVTYGGTVAAIPS